MSECSGRRDPVARMVCNTTAEQFVKWMVDYHGLNEDKGYKTVESNLREAFKWHRLQGRIDRRPLLLVIAEMLGVRQSVKALETPAVVKEAE